MSVQVALGVWTVLSNVSKWVALGHQAVGVALFTVVLVVVHTTTGGRSDRHGNASVDLTQS